MDTVTVDVPLMRQFLNEIYNLRFTTLGVAKIGKDTWEYVRSLSENKKEFDLDEFRAVFEAAHERLADYEGGGWGDRIVANRVRSIYMCFQGYIPVEVQKAAEEAKSTPLYDHRGVRITSIRSRYDRESMDREWYVNTEDGRQEDLPESRLHVYYKPDNAA